LTRLADVVAEQFGFDHRKGGPGAPRTRIRFDDFLQRTNSAGLRRCRGIGGLEAKITMSICDHRRGKFGSTTLEGKRQPRGAPPRKLGRRVFAFGRSRQRKIDKCAICSTGFHNARAGMSEEENMKRRPSCCGERA